MQPFTASLSVLLLTAPAFAQFWYIPDSNAALGTCNVIPFGSSPGSSFAQAEYQSKATAADLGNTPGLITGLGFASCATGDAHFDSIEVVMDHHPAGTQLSTTFAQNLTPNALVVLTATDYTWRLTGNTWNEVGLQNFFPYNGTDDLVVQVTLVNSTAPAGFHRDVRQRVYWTAAAGTPPATGTSSAAALKMEIGMLGARLSTYGIGCNGTSGTPPVHSLSGSSQLGQTIAFDVANGVPSGAAVLLLGFYNGIPYPVELSAFGMPGCFQFLAPATSTFLGLDPAGAASMPLVVPNSPAFAGILLYSQYACVDPGANAAGLTTSNYGRALTGL